MYVYKAFYVHIYKCMFGLAHDFLVLSAFLRINIVCLLSAAAGGHIYEPNISFFYKTGSDNLALARLLGFAM